MPANAVYFTVDSSAWGKLSAVAGHHSFFRAVRSWEFKTVSVDVIGSGMDRLNGIRAEDKPDAMLTLSSAL